jgi:hypothetical protein
MKISKLAIALSAALSLCATYALGQQLRQPQSVQPSSFSYDYYAQEGEQSPSDLEIAPAEEFIVSDDCCDAGCEDDECPPWKLFGETCRGTTAYGWIDLGFTYNAREPASNYNGVITFNDRDDELQMNQLYLVVEKVAESDYCCWDWGYRVDFLYGTDARFTQAVGLELNQDGSQGLNAGHRFYHLAFPQLYLDLTYGDLKMTLGHFYTIIGYEGVMATGPANFFYSHPYCHQYGEPFTHTGLLFTWDYSDRVDFIAGVHNGWDVWSRNNVNGDGADHGGFLGGVILTSYDERTSLALTGTIGNEDQGASVFTQRAMGSVVFSHTFPCERWQYVFQSDAGHQGLASGINNGTEDAEWYGVNQYLFYTINDCWKAGLRFEWFRDDDGARVVGVGDGNPATGPFVGDFYEITMGLNWTPRANWNIRPELRWDWFDPDADTVGAPFNDNNSNSQFTAAIDVIFTY